MMVCTDHSFDRLVKNLDYRKTGRRMEDWYSIEKHMADVLVKIQYLPR